MATELLASRHQPIFSIHQESSLWTRSNPSAPHFGVPTQAGQDTLGLGHTMEFLVVYLSTDISMVSIPGPRPQIADHLFRMPWQSIIRLGQRDGFTAENEADGRRTASWPSWKPHPTVYIWAMDCEGRTGQRPSNGKSREILGLDVVAALRHGLSTESTWHGH